MSRALGLGANKLDSADQPSKSSHNNPETNL